MRECGTLGARLCLFVFLGLGLPKLPARTVWIDTDVSIGSPIREVDDAFALLLAFSSPELRIVALSSSYGNASLRYTDRVARNLATQYGRSARVGPDNVYTGARSRRDLGPQTAASDAIAAAAANERLTYIALGPLTNLATALQLHPDLHNRIEQIIFVGGVRPGETLRFGRNKWLRIHDANVWKDPDSVSVVLQSSIPVVLIPITTGADLTLDQKNFDKLRAGKGANLLRNSATWFFFWTKILKSEGGPLFDDLAVVAAARPELITTERRYALLNRDHALVAGRSCVQGARRVRYCTDFKPQTRMLVMQRLTGQ